MIPSNAACLIVDDNPANQNVALLQLEKLGFQADVASSGLEALAKIKLKKYDLILMDCQMPDMDGYETTRQIRVYEESIGKTHATYIVALTANVGDKEKCLAAGMDHFLSKPIKLQDLQNFLTQEIPQQKDSQSDQITTTDLVDFDYLKEIFSIIDGSIEAEAAIIFQEAIKDLQARVDVWQGPLPEREPLSREAHSLCGISSSLGLKAFAALMKEIEICPETASAEWFQEKLTFSRQLLKESLDLIHRTQPKMFADSEEPAK